MAKDYRNAKEDDIFYMGITYKEANEALNLPADHRLSGLREVFEILQERKLINVWLLGIKEGKRSPSILASGEFPKIVEAYRREKHRISGLVKELSITQKNIDSLEEAEKSACRDRNDIVKLCIIKKLRKKSLIPFDLATMGKQALINKIIESGGLEEFAKEYDLKIPKEQEQEVKNAGKALHETIKKAEDPSHIKRRSSHLRRMSSRNRRGKSKEKGPSIRGISK